MQSRGGSATRRTRTLIALAVAGLISVVGCSPDDDPDRVEDLSDGEESLPTFDFDDDGSGRTVYAGTLRPLNGSNVSGQVTVDASQEPVAVTVEALEVGDALQHLQHLHLGGDGTCPTETADGEELLTTEDGHDVWGSPLIALSTEGDVGADSAADLDRFPSAVDGALGYARTFDLPAPVVAEDLDDAVYVLHGMPTLGGDEAAYDGGRQSTLDADLPLEAGLPIACAELDEQAVDP